MWEITSCYRDNGDLPAALEEAAEVVRRVGFENVVHVIAREDQDILGAWWVDVIYRDHHGNNIMGVSAPKEWTNP